VINDMELGYENSLSFIGSKDSYAPSSVLENFIRNIGGSRKEHLSVSNIGRSRISSAVFNYMHTRQLAF
jgi:hypothetical protein